MVPQELTHNQLLTVSVTHADGKNLIGLPLETALAPFQFIPVNPKAGEGGLTPTMATSRISPKQVETALAHAAGSS
jgi:hypothetical protein